MAKRRRRKAAHRAGGNGKPARKSVFPAWVKPTFAMVLGGGVGLVAMALLPAAIGPYAPALGVAAAKFLGGGGWSKYLVTAGVVGGVTFLSRRKTVQVAAGALTAAKNALVGPPAAPESGSAASQGADILRRSGLSPVR